MQVVAVEAAGVIRIEKVVEDQAKTLIYVLSFFQLMGTGRSENGINVSQLILQKGSSEESRDLKTPQPCCEKEGRVKE